MRARVSKRSQEVVRRLRESVVDYESARGERVCECGDLVELNVGGVALNITELEMTTLRQNQQCGGEFGVKLQEVRSCHERNGI